jgi:hypothetical protein
MSMASEALRKAVPLLRCPLEGCGVRLLTSEELEQLNELIVRGSVKRYDNSLVTSPLADALITVDGSRIYPVWDDVPVMQVFEQIDAARLPAAYSSCVNSPTA